jgi:hypothetical protein
MPLDQLTDLLEHRDGLQGKATARVVERYPVVRGYRCGMCTETSLQVTDA